MRLVLAVICAAAPAVADVWVAYERGIARFADDGSSELVVTRYRNPASVAVDPPRGRVWFVDQYDYTVVCIDAATGEELFALKDVVHSPPAVTPDTYSSPEAEVTPALAVDPGNGFLWVADVHAHQVARLTDKGKELWRSSDFHEPHAITVASDGSAWVVGGISDIYLLAPDGEIFYKRKRGLDKPVDVALNPATGLVWIAEYGSGRVVAIDEDGNLRRKVSVELPYRLAVDPESGSLWVASYYDKIYKVSPSGEVERTIDGFETPVDLAFATGKGVWVADKGDDRVYLLNAAGERLVTIDAVRKPVSLAVE